MADEFAELKVAITASLKDFSAKMDDFGKEMEKVKKPTEETNKGFQQIFTGFVAGQLTVDALKGAFNSLVNTMKQSIDAYDKQYVAEQSLQTALGYTSKALLEQAAAIQKNTRYGDEDVMAAQARIAMFIKEEDVIKKMTPAIVNFAAAKGLSLTAAADAVTKSVASSTNALARYGIQIEGAAGSSQRAQSAIDALNKAFGGQAEAMANAGAGPLIKLNNGISDLQEIMGQAVTQGINPFVNAINAHVIPALNDWLTKALAIGNANQVNQLTHQIEALEKKIEDAKKGKGGYLEAAWAGNAGWTGAGAQLMATKSNQDVLISQLDDLKKKKQALLDQDAANEEKKTKAEAAAAAEAKRTANETAAAEKLKASIATMTSAMEVYKATTTKINAELGAALKNHSADIDAVFKEKAARVEEEGRLEQEIIQKQLDAAKEQSEKTVLQNKLEISRINTKTKLVQLEGEHADAIKKQAQEQARAQAILEKIAEQQSAADDESKAGPGAKSNPVIQMRKQHSKVLAQLRKEQADLEKMDMAEVDRVRARENMKTLIETTASNQRNQIKQMELEYGLQMGVQVASQLGATLNTLFEAGGKKSEALFNMAKAANIASAVMNGALGFTKALAEFPPPINFVMAGLVAASAIGQVAIIAQQKFEPPKGAKGGRVVGPSHDEGGVTLELEGGEHVIRKSSAALYGHKALDAVNRGVVPPSVLASYASSVTSMVGSRGAAGGAVPGGASGDTTIVNFMDKSVMKRFLQSEEGKRAIINHISKNNFTMRKAMSVK